MLQFALFYQEGLPAVLLEMMDACVCAGIPLTVNLQVQDAVVHAFRKHQRKK
jgi:uncharacterized ferredoxin-like protein